MLTPKVGYRQATGGLIDPLACLEREGASVRLVDGQVRLLFQEHVRREVRTRCYAFAQRYDVLLRLQLDVPAGERPRTVRQLLATGRIALRGGRYVRT